MQPRFSDKAVLVTGGNSGSGLASAQAFAAEGARVAITGRDTATLRRATESVRGVLAIRSDASVLGEIEELMGEIGAKRGRLDVLFVNAGIGAFQGRGQRARAQLCGRACCARHPRQRCEPGPGRDGAAAF